MDKPQALGTTDSARLLVPLGYHLNPKIFRKFHPRKLDIITGMMLDKFYVCNYTYKTSQAFHLYYNE